jgi:hypothetical protein
MARFEHPLSPPRPCPKCATHMDLTRTQLGKPGFDLWTFACSACTHFETVGVTDA